MKTQATQDMKCVILQGKGKEVFAVSVICKQKKRRPALPSSLIPYSFAKRPWGRASSGTLPSHGCQSSADGCGQTRRSFTQKNVEKNELFSMFTYGDKDENIVELDRTGMQYPIFRHACVSDPYFLIPAAPMSGENHWQRGQELLISLLPICSP